MIQVRDRLIPLLRLGELFGIRRRAPSASRTARSSSQDDGRPVALLVDELLGKQEVVIKSLGETFRDVRGVAGGAILGDGRIGLILDAGGLVALVGNDVAGRGVTQARQDCRRQGDEHGHDAATVERDGPLHGTSAARPGST